jgi:putative ABC transport system permease protein
VSLAGVVAVFVGVLAVAEGFRATLLAGADDDTLLILRSGSSSELVSILSGEEARIISSRPEWPRDREGPLVSPELFLVLGLEGRRAGSTASVTLRGVGKHAVRVRDAFSMIAGRGLSWGRNELLVGVGAHRTLPGLGLGEEVAIAGQPWAVVGVFATGGREDSELWGDARVLQPLFQRADTVQAVYLKAPDPVLLESAREGFRRDPRVQVEVHRQRDFYARQAEPLTRVIGFFGGFLAVAMGSGALFACLDAMYTSVELRRREIATLRALGFPPHALVASVVSESLGLALAAGAIGAGVAYLAVDGVRATTLDLRAFSQVVFAFAVTPKIVAQGIGIAALLGAVGGLVPALRAVRMPIAQALRGSPS